MPTRAFILVGFFRLRLVAKAVWQKAIYLVVWLRAHRGRLLLDDF